MAHLHRDQRKLLARVRRIQGQIAAVAKLLEADDEQCETVLQTIAACRGGLNALMAEVIAGHIRDHVVPASAQVGQDRIEAAEQVIDIINSYLR